MLTINITGQASFSVFYSLRWTTNLTNHHQFELVVDPTQLGFDSGVGMDELTTLLGKQISIDAEINYPTTTTANRNFRGIITNLSTSGIADQRISIRGTSASIALSGAPRTRSFINKNLAEIFREVTRAYGNRFTTKDEATGAGDTVDYLVQYRETDWEFLQRIAARWGNAVYCNGRAVVLGPLTNGTTVSLYPQDLLDMRVNIEAKPVKNERCSYDYRNHENYRSSTDDFQVDGLNGTSAKIHAESKAIFPVFGHWNEASDPTSDRNLQDCQVQQTNTEISKQYQLWAESKQPAIQLTDVADLRRPDDSFMGSFRVNEITHIFSGNRDYRNEFQGTDASLPSAILHYPMAISNCGPEPAEVVENEDPEGMNRVKVRFAWQDESTQTHWIRVPSLGAGEGRGNFWPPEIKDRVFVDFENGNPDRPFVTGNFYHAKAKPGYSDADNNIKYLKTRSGNELLFSDEAGKETIRLLSPDEKNEITFTLSDGGSIKIASAGKLLLKAQEIAMVADQISLDGQNDLKLTGNRVGVTAETQLKMEATEAQLKANGTATLKSKAKLTIGSDALTEVKAPLITLN